MQILLPGRLECLALLASLLLCSALVAQTAKTPATATVAGKAVNSVTGEALRKTEITLSSGKDTSDLEAAMALLGGPADPSATPPPPVKSMKATTDANGEFHIDHIEPGEYFFTATHAGYVDGEYTPDGSTARGGQIKIAAGDALTGIVFHLVPQGALSGRVVDEDGDPVAGAMVSALGGGRMPGKKLAPVDTAPANDRGEFRLGKIPPGHYYLSANVLHMDFSGAAAPAPPADGTPEMNYVATYFPGAVDVTDATKIDVAAGADLTGFTIRLQKSRVARVKGQALAPDGTPLKGGQVMLTSETNVGSMQMTAVHSDGTFELANVQPGAYILMSIQMNGTQPTMQMQALVVPKEGVTGVKLRAQPDRTMQGKVLVEGNSKVPVKGMMVMLTADEGMAAMPAMGNVTEAGTFTLKATGGAYRLQVPKLPDGAYLKSVMWSGREMLGKLMDFSAGAAGEITITLGVDGGTVDATVTGPGDKPAAESTVVLIPADPAQRSEATAKSSDTDAKGKVTFKDVAPGDYLAFAWKEVDTDAWLDADFLKPFEKDAKRVQLSAKGSEKVELRELPASK